LIGDRLQAALETQLLDAVGHDNRDALRRCLRIYATVDRVRNSSVAPGGVYTKAIFMLGMAISDTLGRFQCYLHILYIATTTSYFFFTGPPPLLVLRVVEG
jgi:hypothetical protein